jgi:hypothetical protein
MFSLALTDVVSLAIIHPITDDLNAEASDSVPLSPLLPAFVALPGDIVLVLLLLFEHKIKLL